MYDVVCNSSIQISFVLFFVVLMSPNLLLLFLAYAASAMCFCYFVKRNVRTANFSCRGMSDVSVL